MHVCLDRFGRIVFAGGNLFERGRVDDIIHALHCALQSFLVAHITDEETHDFRVFPVRGLVGHHELLELIAGIHNDLLRAVMLQHIPDKTMSERACASGDQNSFAIQKS